MAGDAAGSVRYLLSAGNAGGRDDRLLRLGPDRWEEPELADAHGEFVVLRLEAERAGHAAAPGVNLDDVGTGDAAQQRHRGSSTGDRLLVAVPVEQHAAAPQALLPPQADERPAPRGVPEGRGPNGRPRAR